MSHITWYKISARSTPSTITNVEYEVAGASTIARTAIPRRVIVSGTHNGANNSASLVDTTKDFLAIGVRVGDIIRNTTDGSSGTVASITTTTNPNDTLTTSLSGGTDNDFDTSDAYSIDDGEDFILRAKNFECVCVPSGGVKKSYPVCLWLPCSYKLPKIPLNNTEMETFWKHRPG